MSSGKTRPENADVDRRVKRRPQWLQRNRWPPSWVVPSFVTISELQRGHDINIPPKCSAYLTHADASDPVGDHDGSGPAARA